MVSQIDFIVEKLLRDFLREIESDKPANHNSVAKMNLEMLSPLDRRWILESYGDELFKIANHTYDENKVKLLITEIKKAYTLA